MCELHRVAQPSTYGVTTPRKPCVAASGSFEHGERLGAIIARSGHALNEAASCSAYAIAARRNMRAASDKSALSPCSSVPARRSRYPASTSRARRVSGALLKRTTPSSRCVARRARSAVESAIAAVSLTGSGGPPCSHWRQAVAARRIARPASIKISSAVIPGLAAGIVRVDLQ